MNEIAPMEQFSEAPVVEACARAPVGLLAELTHRCPLQCPYCSNPLELDRVNTELTTGRMAGRDAASRRTRNPADPSVGRRADG